MPSFSHMASVVDSIRPKDRLTNELVLKMVETMRGYHDHALLQTVKNKGRLNMRIHKPMEFVEYEGQEFLKVKRPTSSFKSVDEKEKWKVPTPETPPPAPPLPTCVLQWFHWQWPTLDTSRSTPLHLPP